MALLLSFVISLPIVIAFLALIINGVSAWCATPCPALYQPTPFFLIFMSHSAPQPFFFNYFYLVQLDFSLIGEAMRGNESELELIRQCNTGATTPWRFRGVRYGGGC